MTDEDEIFHALRKSEKRKKERKKETRKTSNILIPSGLMQRTGDSSILPSIDKLDNISL